MVETNGDFTVEQNWEGYSDQDHGIWRRLFDRQSRLLVGRACDDFLVGLQDLGVAADGIPHFGRLSEILTRATGWRIVAVPGLVPDDVFFGHLAARRFPVTHWIRRPEQLDYLQEPDVFHDVFGHVPLLMNPIFADYLQAYGKGGLKALRLGALPYLARLYWYTVEFGLIETRQGMRIYGAGIVSSMTESVYALESVKPRRIGFDLMRIMQTEYRIDDLQDCYFVIDSYEQLFDATRPDFTPYYETLRNSPTLTPTDLTEKDRVITSVAATAA